MIEWLVWILVPIFGAAALLSLVRILIGPSVLDRVVAADVLVATILCGLGAEMAINHHATTLPVALGLALFAVFGSISVAKFMANREED
ncbi:MULTISPECIES: monovalent cation/H+ antiporter complex subunit F [Rathayibacter]|jgi:multicomponent Na+:H+ antiporter subunit F|uniref:Sodium:proton antiporter n=2 Tax=Rathayibacter festucae TaxID=110937 RepID=A0A3T0T2I9_9MICO|nr:MULTISPECIES: monovalent cation/H+ antiporter complex subunit F [Rathayibacter]AZZ52750.1 sodium:proton antiporter [Rathayibacter festucae DSM 15932]MCJ1672012.1 monovalent cation/H+ antiporter complex subunit F [Rathayibacter sp. VKM Ac-2929]MCJ1683819.1 monovalent cation/H+ antiporter complex subunit F [Rathayibacter sp. VKM Ac-2928]MCJ1686610.1 monovalent cation/H+ antiporter complex subunit F [Rathayibacter sp. VKM Ac-2927]MCJ1701313.1 monovalent cation/H+ antiporter complex subunit F [